MKWYKGTLVFHFFCELYEDVILPTHIYFDIYFRTGKAYDDDFNVHSYIQKARREAELAREDIPEGGLDAFLDSLDEAETDEEDLIQADEVRILPMLYSIFF